MKTGGDSLPRNTTQTTNRRSSRASRAGLWLPALIVSLAGGCTPIAVRDQGRVSKPNMTFADTAAFSYDSSMVVQVEPGASTTGGAQAGGCTSCR